MAGVSEDGCCQMAAGNAIKFFRLDREWRPATALRTYDHRSILQIFSGSHGIGELKERRHADAVGEKQVR
jgi:hypothetical protein